MKTKFYSHLIEIESIIVELDQMELSVNEKHELAELVDSNMHHTVLDAIMSHLSEADKKVFMEYLMQDDHSKIWDHLNSRVDNIEEKIKVAASALKEDLHKDIKEAKKYKEAKGK